MGGSSAERAISLLSGKEVANFLKKQGFIVSTIDVDHKISQNLRDFKPDVVFNALHGRFGEDGCIQGMLELMQIPYTHSGVLASAIAMNKVVSKAMFSANEIRCPANLLINQNESLKNLEIKPPYVVKPINEGSSVGVVIVKETKDVINFSEDSDYGDDFMVEEYIPGRELTVAVMGGLSLGVLEIKSSNQFYDYEAKYSKGRSTYIVPATIPKETYDYCMEYASRAHKLLGCRGVTRSDFRWNETKGDTEGIYLLEVNTQPGMTSTSLVPQIAKYAGYTFGELVQWMVEDADCLR